MELKAPAQEPSTRRSWAILLTLYAAIFLLTGWGLERMEVFELVGTSAPPPPVAGPAPAPVQATPPRLVVQIGARHMRTLHELRDRAIADGVLLDRTYVPAQVGHEGTAHPAKLRLKGDWTDHLDGNAWSFRVHIKASGAVLGMRRFSLQHPKTRDYLQEVIFLEAARREGVVAPRYGFATLELNGSALGLYAVEEHFDAVMLASNQRREGPILKFDEDPWWSDTREGIRLGLGGAPLKVHPQLLDHLEPFEVAKTLATPALRSAFLLARDSMHAMFRGEVPVEDVLSVDHFARLCAVSMVLGATHALALHNSRFYMNPVTSRLEPVAFDGMAGARIQTLRLPWNAQGRVWLSLYSNPAFLRLYMAHLRRVTQPKYLAELLAAESLRAPAAWLARHFPRVRFNPNRYKENAAHLARILQAPGRLTRAFLEHTGGELVIAVTNLQEVPAEVKALLVNGKRVPVSRSVLLTPRATDDSFHRIRFPLPDPPTPDLVLELVVAPLSGTERTEEVHPWPADGHAPERRALTRAGPARPAELWTVDALQKTITIEPGDWTVTETLVVPEGHVLRCEGGTRLTFAKGGSLVAFGPLRLNGQADAPITLRAEADGGGLAVLDAASPSKLQHVRFVGLGPPTVGRWSPTGGVTFYESDVELTDCAFIDGRAEDALNIIRSEFLLAGCTFRQSAHDALDVDFSRGTVRGCTFTDTGNDAIDLSGSVVRIEDVEVAKAGDKGISVGEQSDVTATNVRISDAVLGIAVKDGSRASVKGGAVRRTRVAVALYVKKSEFGPPSAAVEGLAISESERPAYAERDATLLLDGERVPAAPRSVILDLLGPK